MEDRLRDFIIKGRVKLKKENLQKFIIEKLSNSDEMELNIKDEEWVLDYLKEEGFYVKNIRDYNIMVFLYERDMRNSTKKQEPVCDNCQYCKENKEMGGYSCGYFGWENIPEKRFCLNHKYKE